MPYSKDNWLSYKVCGSLPLSGMAVYLFTSDILSVVVCSANNDLIEHDIVNW